MTDLHYTATPDAGRDVTAVMGRRILAWVLDLLLYIGFAVAMYAVLADYVELPGGAGFLDACDLLQSQDSDAAAGCVEVGDRAYITSSGDNSIQTLASVGYFVFFVVLQGLVGASPGKLLTGLRVVDGDGGRCGIGRSLVRTLLWIVDAAPWFLPLVGLITGLTTTGHRRVGDMAASTYVVSRGDVGQPVTTGAPVTPPAQNAWGAPPPTSWGPPSAPPSAAAPAPPSAMPPPPTGSAIPPSTPPSSSSAVDDLTPEISGVPDEQPAPPPVPDTAPPTWTPPTLDDPSATDPASVPPEAAAPPTPPEIDGPVDIPAPEVAADDAWWSGPEAEPEADATASEPSEAPIWEDPSPDPDTTGDSWAPPETPTADISPTDDTSPTAGPTPFTAPGADPVTDAPASPEPTPRPPPQWDPARNTYIQWEPALQQWLQWDDGAQRWKDIDT